MWNKHAYKKELLAKMEEMTPRVDCLEKKEEKKVAPSRHKGLFWALGSAAFVGVVVGGGYGIYHAFQRKTPTTEGKLLIAPQAKEAVETISETSRAIYQTFVKKTTYQALADNYRGASLSYSPVDAFLSLSMEVYASSPAVQASYAAALGAASMDEVNEAGKEISLFLGTPQSSFVSTRLFLGDFGGACFNSLWLSPETPLVANPSATLAGLAHYYYASVYHQQPSSEALNDWLRSVAPAGFNSLPHIDIPAGSNAALASATFLRDEYEETVRNRLYEQYTSQKHYLDFALADKTTKKADYIESTSDNSVDVSFGDHYVSAPYALGGTTLHFSLPEEGYTPLAVLPDVLAKNTTSVGNYRLTLKAPYFQIDSQLGLLSLVDTLAVSSLKTSSLQGLVDPRYGESLEGIAQFSLLRFNYDGFYAVSATVSYDSGSFPISRPFYELTLNRPFLFSVEYSSLPLFYGIVMAPNYPAFGS